MADDYEALKALLAEYLREMDNSVPDTLYRHSLRNRLRKAIGLPEVITTLRVPK